jgi:sugar phosphate isomerase/epimerase
MKEQLIGKPKRGVSAYSYNGEFGVTMNLEDILQEMNDIGARGLEILSNSHIPNYPNIDDAWLAEWDRLMLKYDIEPVEYGHWVDSRLYKGRELTTKESVAMLERDFKIANRLGFKILRTKLGVIDMTLTPVANWREFIGEALPMAESYDVRMCPEIHSPTILNSAMIDNYVKFIEKTGTKHFGLNIDFSIFQTGDNSLVGFGSNDFVGPLCEHSLVEELIPLLPYVYCCHAKFLRMSEDFKEVVIPYEEIISTLVKHNWDGYLLSEYEGPNAKVPGYTSDQIRRHHVMMKRLLGE